MRTISNVSNLYQYINLNETGEYTQRAHNTLLQIHLFEYIERAPSPNATQRHRQKEMLYDLHSLECQRIFRSGTFYQSQYGAFICLLLQKFNGNDVFFFLQAIRDDFSNKQRATRNESIYGIIEYWFVKKLPLLIIDFDACLQMNEGIYCCLHGMSKMRRVM